MSNIRLTHDAFKDNNLLFTSTIAKPPLPSSPIIVILLILSFASHKKLKEHYFYLFYRVVQNRHVIHQLRDRQ